MSGEKLKKLNAVYLVSIGKANAEQQKIAYKHMLEIMEREQQARKLPVKQTKTIGRCIRAHIILNYFRNEGEPISTAEACNYVAESNGVKVETVKRDYRKWLADTNEIERERAVYKYAEELYSTFF